MRNLLRAAAGAGGVGRFLHVSTTDVYGYPAVPCTESQPLRAVGLPYNRSKCLGEECVWEAARAGLPVTVVRPATIYGPRGKAFSEDIAAHLRRGTMAVVDGGRSRGGFSYVDNVAEAIIQAAFAPATIDRAYNLADGTGVTWRAYLDRMAAGLGCRPPVDQPARPAGVRPGGHPGTASGPPGAYPPRRLPALARSGIPHRKRPARFRVLAFGQLRRRHAAHIGRHYQRKPNVTGRTVVRTGVVKM